MKTKVNYRLATEMAGSRYFMFVYASDKTVISDIKEIKA